jgi:hypothetical protein
MDVSPGFHGAFEMEPQINCENIYHLIRFDKLHADTNSDSRPLLKAEQHREGPPAMPKPWAMAVGGEPRPYILYGNKAPDAMAGGASWMKRIRHF